MRQIVRTLGVIAAAALLSACPGNSPEEPRGLLPHNPDDPRVTIEPDPAVAVKGSSVLVRVDVIGAAGQAPAAYEFDFDEFLSKVDVDTAPCPAALGRPACQEWTIRPALDSVPGHYPIRLRTRGLLAGVARGSFLLKIVDERAWRFGGAVSVAESGDRRLFLTSEGRIIGGGHNGHSRVGPGYLQQPFNDEGPPGFTGKMRVNPTSTPMLAPLFADAAEQPQFISVAASTTKSYAVSADGRIWRWGAPDDSRLFPARELEPHEFRYRPTPVQGFGPAEGVRAISVVESPCFAPQIFTLGSDGRVWTWDERAGDPDPGAGRTPAAVRHPLRRDELITGVTSISGSLMLMQDGRVFDSRRTADDQPQLPQNIVQIVQAHVSTVFDHHDERMVAVDADGGLWIWSRACAGRPAPEPRLLEPFTDVIAASVDSLGRVYALRRGSSGVTVIFNTRPNQVVGETFHEVAPLAASRGFSSVGPRYAFTHECEGSSGTPWRLQAVGGAVFPPNRFIAVAESGFGVGGFDCPLAPTDYSQITMRIEGEGRIVMAPGGLECSRTPDGVHTNCEGRFRNGSHVQLHPAPGPGWRFTGWRTDRCSHVAGEWVYEVNPDRVEPCTAVFERRPPLEHRITVHATEGGSVRSEPEGIACGSLCSHWFASDRAVRLIAEPRPGYEFAGFAGDPDCSDGEVVMSVGVVCSVRFTASPPPPAPLNLTAVPTRTTVLLQWTSVEAATAGYRVERGEAGAFTSISDVISPADTQFTDTGVQPGTLYVYRVFARGPLLESFAEASVTTLADAPPPPGAHRLAVARSGNGGGGVSSTPAGIDCGIDCTQDYAEGAVITLTAAPDTASALQSWSGCDNTNANECVVTMNASRNVTAVLSAVAPPSFALTVTRNGQGTGEVFSFPAGVSCGDDCTQDFLAGTTVQLVAQPLPGHVFAGWSGCQQVANNQCTVEMTQARSIAATFDLNPNFSVLTVTRSGPGAASGRVVSDFIGIDCGDACSARFLTGGEVMLTPAPDSASVQSWAGCDGVTNNQCRVLMAGDRSVSVSFSAPGQLTLRVNKSGDGSGLVTSQPAGISCGATCAADFNGGETVGLFALPSGGSQFMGWSGCDRTVDANICEVDLQSARSVTAIFQPE